MSVIQRPSKQSGATTYQGKVAAGYTKILASEMDADLDLIYSAWNGGVDAVNIADGVITGPKLAAGAVGSRELADSGVATVDLADAAVTTPKIADNAVTGPKIAAGAITTRELADGGVATVDLADGAVTDAKVSNVSAGKLTSGIYPVPILMAPRGQLTTSTAAGVWEFNGVGTPTHDTGKAAWRITGDYGVSDTVAISRAPAPGSTFTDLFRVDAAGNVTGRINANAGGVTTPGAFGPIANSATVQVTLSTLWADAGGLANPGASEVHSPAWNTFVTVCACLSLSGGNGGLGIFPQIDQNPGPGWSNIAGMIANVETTNILVSRTLPCAANTRFRLMVFNGTGGNVTLTGAYLSIAVHGWY